MAQIRQCDYSKLLALTLAEYFYINRNWCIVPEFVLDDNLRPDYLLSIINVNRNSPFYGSSRNNIVVETKIAGTSYVWKTLLDEQGYDQCQNAAISGKIYFIGLVGFEICYFYFDVNAYPSDSGKYTSF